MEENKNISFVNSPKQPVSRENISETQQGRNFVDVKINIEDSILPYDFSGILNVKYNVGELATASVPVLFVLHNNAHIFEGHLLMPKIWKNQPIMLSFMVANSKYTSKKAVDITKDNETFEQQDFTREYKASPKRKLQIALVAAIVLLVVGFVLGIGTAAMFSSPSATEQPMADVATDTVAVAANADSATVNVAQTAPDAKAQQTAQPAERKWIKAKDGLYYCRDNGGNDTNCIYAQRLKDTASLRLHIERGRHMLPKHRR